MTKERLEELIKQGATIYYLAIPNAYTEIYLCETGFYIDNKGNLLQEKSNGWVDTCAANKLFETKEQVEWGKKTHAERTERFEPPMWEDIEKDGYLFTFIKPKDIHTIAFAVNWGVLWENEIVVLYDDDYCVYENRIIFDESATKENYEKACEIVRNLFKGESNGKNA